MRSRLIVANTAHGPRPTRLLLHSGGGGWRSRALPRRQPPRRAHGHESSSLPAELAPSGTSTGPQVRVLSGPNAAPVAAMVGEPSKELLDLPSEPKPPSLIESLLASREEQKQHKEGKRKAGPPTDPLPNSQVLGKVKDFLGEIAKANDKLQFDAQNKPPEEYDIEALTGNEKEYIEMDLLLGVADLHSEKAIEVAEATINGFTPSGRAFTCSSSDSEDDSDDGDEDGGNEPNMPAKDECKDPDGRVPQPAKGKKPSKIQKIVVLN
ncbi:hypothetical protein GUJ93_ZPchr0008g12261 [Zizania palustris]|uniref:Uncharacterized protein n=1 Tax=Zizania palustris TaxID=103762 RepID=A0A8J5RFH4_ZIZPA|nr:hypothetical protein GUJ93_ZPchr0008g12261 [Zizania palustris]